MTVIIFSVIFWSYSLYAYNVVCVHIYLYNCRYRQYFLVTDGALPKELVCAREIELIVLNTFLSDPELRKMSRCVELPSFHIDVVIPIFR